MICGKALKLNLIPNVNQNKDKMRAIEHFKKLLQCDQFILTGSHALAMLGLMTVGEAGEKDIDILLVNPTEESLAILKKLKINQGNPNYPPDANYYRVEYESIYVDFFVKDEVQKSINVDGVDIAYPIDIVNAKQRYGGLKHILHLKGIAELFYTQDLLVNFLKNEQAKVFPLPKSTPLPKSPKKIEKR